MFSRRRGSSASRRPLVDATTSSNAAVAASQAFLRKSNSNASLSSAAAAAALRSVTSSPEPVGNVVTKRMIRRGSVSSIGSGSVAGGSARGGPVRPGLQRQNSSGSMSERTFRSPSPGRHNSAVPASADAPPVPAIPSRMPFLKGHQRSSSVEPPPRVLSPTPRRGGRNMSVDRANIPPPLSSGSGKRLSDVHEELQRTDSNTSVNFSRPRSSQPSSPVMSSPAARQFTHGTGAWHSEPTGVATKSTVKNNVNDAKVARIQAAANQAIGKPASTARPLPQTNTSYEGPPSLSYQSESSVMVYDPNTRTFISKPRPKPKRIDPPAPALAVAPALPPGSYDPNTRSFVPVSPSGSKQPSPVTTPRVEKLRPELPVVDTELQPPPRNPARLSPTSSPTTTRPVLPTLPSVVRENPAAEARAETEPTVRTTTSATLTTPTRQAKVVAATEPKSLRTSESLARGRNLSSSPSPQRAHFSQSPIIEAHKHSPPGRDISPAKSALKHSPANSLRANSPLIFTAKSPPSEVSDASDIGSVDGLSAKKRKSVRVSFEEQPIEIKPAPATVARDQTHDDDEDDDDEIMGPRPALPSFGSVRRDRIGAEVAEKVTETPPARHGVSSDHAIGGILKTATDPLAPEVTSKEASGYVSDDSDEPAANVTTHPSEVLGSERNSDLVETKIQEVNSVSPASPEGEDHAVPAINLLPPTPGTEEENKVLGHAADLGEEDENQAEVVSAGAASASVAAIEADEDLSSYITPGMLAAIDEDSDDTGEFSDAAEDLSELDNGGFASLDAIAVSPVNTAKANAAPASPPESPSVKQAAKIVEKVETKEENDKRNTGDWTEATAYWKRLSRQQREQMEREHLSSDDEARPSSKATRKSKINATEASAGIANAPTATTVRAPNPAVAQKATTTPASKTSQPTKPTLKKSLRDQPQSTPTGDAHARTSMRNGGAMAKTLRNGPVRPQSTTVESQVLPVNKPTRPMSSGPLPPANKALASQPPRPQDSSYPRVEPKRAFQPAPVVSQRLQKELSRADDSDSESSFRKRRRGQAKDTGGRYSMRRSMRGAPAGRGPTVEERPTSPTPAKGKRALSIRSLSPTGSFLSRNRGEKLRESLRGNDSATRLTLRGPQSLRSDSKTRFGGSARPSSTQAASSRFRSRFVDSDDEDDRAPARGAFRSRFADSDDEDNIGTTAANLTPVRGIPRRSGYDDGDSTDLEDEDEDTAPRKKTRGREKMAKPMVPDPADIDKAMEAARKKLGMTNGNTTVPTQPADNKEGTVLTRGSLRARSNSDMPNTKPPPEESIQGSVNGDTPTKRRGIMGNLLRRNRASTASVPTINYGRTSAIPPSSLPGGAAASPTDESKFVTAPPPFRSSMPPVPRLARGDSNYSNATAPPMIGDHSENWPLPPPIPDIPGSVLRNGSILNGNARPNTSDGSPHKARRTGSVHFEDGVASNQARYSNRTGKKKKFGIIRRAFGLND